MAPAGNAAWFCLSTAGSDPPHVPGEPKGGEETLLSRKVCSIPGPEQHKQHLCRVTVTQRERRRWRKWPWCQSEGNSPLFPCCSDFPREIQFFPVLGPGGVPACCVLPCALCFLVVCKQEPWVEWLITPVLANWFTTLTPAFSAT